jgi:hypothetical protein
MSLRRSLWKLDSNHFSKETRSRSAVKGLIEFCRNDKFKFCSNPTAGYWGEGNNEALQNFCATLRSSSAISSPSIRRILLQNHTFLEALFCFITSMPERFHLGAKDGQT